MKFLNYLAIAAIALGTVSCDDDDPVQKEVVSPVELIAGSYNGGMSMIVGEPGEPSDATVVLKAQKDGKLTIVIPEVGSGKMVMPELELTDAKVEKVAGKEGEYTISKEAFVINNPGMPLTNKKGLKGTVKGTSIELSYDIQPGAMPMAIQFSFKGTKK